MMRNLLKVSEFGGQERNLTADASLFSATLCCILNNLSDIRWPPKYLRNRERHENRGWKSWVQNSLHERPKLVAGLYMALAGFAAFRPSALR